MTEPGKVFLVGAGPGDPELITARGLRRLSQADVVLYDALVHPDQLDHAQPDAELVFVGKRAGRASERQTAIHAKMAEAARAGKTVVRLKGGDPYLFGRGSEEAEFLADAGIAFEVVPGVPSPLAATAYAGLSLTHRALASSVAYVTATESVEKDRTDHDWAKLATATQTLVIFMGMRKLESLMNLLIEHGRPPTTPAAVVQWASLPRQKTVVGTVQDIHERAQSAELGLPALTIVGDVVQLRASLRWFDAKPLFGKRVLVTRAVRQSGSLAQLVRDEAAQPIVAPTIRFGPPSDPGPLHDAVHHLDCYDWLLFTSANAVDATFRVMADGKLDARAIGAAKVCAIGEKTASALRRRGVMPDLVPSDSRAEGVIAELQPRLEPGARILLPRAEVARELIPDTLRKAGMTVDVAAAYRTLPPEPEEAERVAALVESGVDAVLLTSSSTVDNLVSVLGQDAASALSQVDLFSIGPVTTETAQGHSLTIAATSPTPTVETLVDTMRSYYAQGDVDA